MTNAMEGAPWLHALARVFENAQAPLYLVGGAVRNPLMGLPISDVDVCGPTLPQAVTALCEGTGVRAVLRAAHFGTVELHVADASGAHCMAEYTTFREDSYRCGHKPDSVRFTTDLRVDALRRDFSVNAMYRRITTDGLGELIDPTGGLDHLRAGVLHTVTDDPDRVLQDDGLRILRAARFQAELDLRPTDALRKSLRRHAALLSDIAPERIRDELQKTLLADLRYPMLKRRESGTASGLKTVRACGAWPYVMGELAWDAQAAEALGRLQEPQGGASALVARLALLCRHAEAKAAYARLTYLRFSQKDAKAAVDIAELIRAFERGETEPLKCAVAGRDALVSAGTALAALGDGAALARCQSMLAYLRDKPCSLRELAANGNDLLPLLRGAGRPARDMGGLLDALWKSALGGHTPNEREALLKLAKQLVYVTNRAGDPAT